MRAFWLPNKAPVLARLSSSSSYIACPQEMRAFWLPRKAPLVKNRLPLSLGPLQEMRAFWLPSKAPEAKALLEKPDTATYCPASGKKLTIKQLVSVKFTP